LQGTELHELKKNKIKEKKRMKKVVVFMAAVVFLICFGAGAIAQEAKGEAASPKKAAPGTKAPKVVKERVVTKTSMVEAIDLQNRVVTLKDKDGNVWDLKVGERAKNLPQVKVGDQVVVKFYESIVVELAKPGSQLEVSTSESVSAAKTGAKPAGKVEKKVTVVANIETIDPRKTFVILKGPEGRTVKVKVREPKNLENVKVGDQVRITYTEALAISVKTVKKAKGK